MHPSTAADFVAAGYTYINTTRCKAAKCGAEIEWWRTPNGKKLALDPVTFEPHYWSTCPSPDEFRQG
jgi:hypothetical protein